MAVMASILGGGLIAWLARLAVEQGPDAGPF
jgi:hypothetical protein